MRVIVYKRNEGPARVQVIPARRAHRRPVQLEADTFADLRPRLRELVEELAGPLQAKLTIP